MSVQSATKWGLSAALLLTLSVSTAACFRKTAKPSDQLAGPKTEPKEDPAHPIAQGEDQAKHEVTTGSEWDPSSSSATEHEATEKHPCAALIAAIPSGSYLHIIQNSLKNLSTEAKRSKYLCTHARGLLKGNYDDAAADIGCSTAPDHRCLSAVSALDSYKEVLTMRMLTTAEANAMVEIKTKLAQLRMTEFPVRSCVAVLSSVKSTHDLRRFSKDLGHRLDLAELNMHRFLEGWNSFGANRTGKSITAAGCLMAFQRLSTEGLIWSYDRLSHAEQLALLRPMTKAIGSPSTLAH
jgi:hypothetical protein